MEPEQIKKKILENKLAAVGVLILFIFLLGTLSLSFSIFASSLGGVSSQADYQKFDKNRPTEGDAGGVLPPYDDNEVSGSYVEVQEGDIEINSENIEKDISKLNSIAEENKGYVEKSSKREGKLYTNAELTVRVPSENFQGFIDRIKENYDVESYNIENYRISTQREMDELKILNKSLEDYEKIRSEINQMENSKDKLDLLMDVTDNELELQEKRKRYQRDLSDKQQRGDLATVEVSLQEKSKVDLMPDNIGNRIKSEVREMLDNVVDTVIATFTSGIEIFFKVIQYIIYIAIVAVPLAIAYKIIEKAYIKWF